MIKTWNRFALLLQKINTAHTQSSAVNYVLAVSQPHDYVKKKYDDDDFCFMHSMCFVTITKAVVRSTSSKKKGSKFHKLQTLTSSSHTTMQVIHEFISLIVLNFAAHKSHISDRQNLWLCEDVREFKGSHEPTCFAAENEDKEQLVRHAKTKNIKKIIKILYFH